MKLTIGYTKYHSALMKLLVISSMIRLETVSAGSLDMLRDSLMSESLPHADEPIEG